MFLDALIPPLCKNEKFMPILTLNELGEAVFQEKIKGVAVDTSIFQQYQFGFEVGLLAKLQQFAGTTIKHVLPDVIKHEVQRHMLSEATLHQAHVKNALKPLGGAWGTSIETRDAIFAQLFAGKTPQTIVDERLAALENSTGAEVLVCSDLATLDDVLDLYLRSEAPFANREDKKNEFPDAIALCALDKWAENAEGLILAVSKDGDWQKFADQSNHVCVLSDLRQGLAVFQANREGLKGLLIEAFGGAKWQTLEAALFASINGETDNIDATLEAASSYSYEAELVEVQLSARPGGETALEQAEVVNLEDGVMEVSLVLPCSVEARFSVSFQVWDGIDREYVGMGSSEVVITEEYDLEMLLTFELDDGNVTFVSASPQSTTLTFESGEVEPNWSD